MSKDSESKVSISNPELIEASEHLHYEIWMLYKSMEFFFYYQNSPPQMPRNSILWLPQNLEQIHRMNPADLQIHKNSFLQSFLVHFRNLTCFIYEIHVNPDNDVVAAHYFDEPIEWRKKRPKKTKSFEIYLDNIAKTIVHLTYSRKDGSKRLWPLDKMAMNIRKPLINFNEMVSEEKVIPNFKKEVSAILLKY